MFEKLKSGFKGLVTKVTTVELKPENLQPILEDFKMTLAENDVAFPVADRISDELEKTMASAQQQFAQVAQRINAGRSRAESLLATVREGTA